MKPSIHGKELSCLDVRDFYLLLWRAGYSSRVYDDWQVVRGDSADLVLAIQLTP